MKKAKLVLQRQTIRQLTGRRLGGVRSGNRPEDDPTWGGSDGAPPPGGEAPGSSPCSEPCDYNTVNTINAYSRNICVGGG